MALLALIALAAFGVAGAAAEDGDPVAKPPLLNGGTNFPTIKDASYPEQFIWEVQLGPGQELVQVDERTAHVLFEDGARSWTITAEQARDATGAEVPTSFAVVAPNYVQLTVHHKAGNPKAGGAPFRYPVSAGSPFTAGYSTVTFTMPPGEPPAPTCVVPGLTGLSLAGTRAKLTAAGCRLGAVRGKRGRPVNRLRVVKQFRDPGAVFDAGSKVAVKLG